MRGTFNRKNLRINESGITLIAVVITIIVLIILAGVAISMLSGDNGILNQAASAKEKTEKANIEENIKLGVIAAMTNENHAIESEETLKTALVNQFGISEDKVDVDEYGDSGYKVTVEDVSYIVDNNGAVRKETEIDKLIVSGESVSEKTTIEDANADKITIPEGFKIATDSATLVKDGIVVVAPDNSEFVWVPVEDVTTMYGTDADGNKLGKLYKFTDANTENNTAYNWTETDGVMSWTKDEGSRSYREPDILKDSTYGDACTTADRGLNLLKEIVGIKGTIGEDDEEMLTIWKNQLQDEYDEMIESVSINGGFYVGRYETSLSSSGNAQSIQGATSATAARSSANTWYGLYQKEKEYSEKNSLTNVVGSTMIWGSQYDQMLIWMQGNDINVASSTPIEGASKNTGSAVGTTGTTGTVGTDKLNNIYDILGNGFEWTLEAYDTRKRVYRRRRLLREQLYASLPQLPQSVHHRLRQHVASLTLYKVELDSKSDSL